MRIIWKSNVGGALGFLDPEAAAAQLAAALQQATLSGEIAVRICVAGLATTLSTPLARYGKLLTYAAGLEAMETGRVDQARKLLEGLGDTEIEIGKIRLKSPRRVLLERLPSSVTAVTGKEDRAVEPQVSETIRNTVVICCSHQDKKWLDQLLRFLKPLESAVSLEVWDDVSLTGSKWQEELRHALASTKVAVLMVSPYFLESDYIANFDLPPLLEAAEREGAVILPIILTHCLFEKSELSHFQPINEPSRPLSRLSSEQRDKMLVQIAKKIGENFDSVAESEFEDRLESSTATEPIKKGIYLSYGRDDDKAHIRKLVVELRHNFGKDLVWMADHRVQSDPAFDDWIRGKVKQAAVMLVVIGPHWLSPTLSKWVHTEVKAALESHISIIPVLVGGAYFPSLHDLPSELARLADIQSGMLNDATWNQDFENLIHTLKRLLDEADLKDKAPKDKRAFVPDKPIDVFVSYAHIDDEPPQGSAYGWVTRFVEELRKVLSLKLGWRPDVWMDHTLVGNELFSDTLMEQMARSRTFVLFISPAYLKSLKFRHRASLAEL